MTNEQGRNKRKAQMSLCFLLLSPPGAPMFSLHGNETGGRCGYKYSPIVVVIGYRYKNFILNP